MVAAGTLAGAGLLKPTIFMDYSKKITSAFSNTFSSISWADMSVNLATLYTTIYVTLSTCSHNWSSFVFAIFPKTDSNK